MKQKTKKILIVLIIVLSSLFTIAYLRLPVKEDRDVSSNTNKVVEITKEEFNTTTKKEITPPSKSINEVTKISEGTIKASIVVLGKSYDAYVSEGKNIYDLMTVLANNSKDTNFTFHAQEYKGMGYFIDTINGVSGSPGAYWVYYINDKKATVGISQYILKEGDSIRWAQEGFTNN